jgi:hypothetical protein
MAALGLLGGVIFSALILGVTVLAVVEHLLHARRRPDDRTDEQRHAVGRAGFDMISALFTPTYRNKLEYDDAQEVRRDQPGENAPPRSRIDLNSGTARLVLPRHPPHPPG